MQALPGQGFSSQPFSDHTLMPVPTTQKTLVLGFFYAALAAALWSLITPFSRELFDCGVTPLATAFWRPLFGGLCFAAYAAATGCLRGPFRDGLLMFAIGGIVGALMFGSFQVSIDKSGGATAVVLLYTAPAWVAILSRLLFHEGISKTKLCAIAIALLGVILVSLSGGSHSSANSHCERSMQGVELKGNAQTSYCPFFAHRINASCRSGVERSHQSRSPQVTSCVHLKRESSGKCSVRSIKSRARSRARH